MSDFWTKFSDLRKSECGGRYIDWSWLMERRTSLMRVKHAVEIDTKYYLCCGIPLIPDNDGYLLYLSCEYCRCKELPEKNLLMEWACQKCGAPIVSY